MSHTKGPWVEVTTAAFKPDDYEGLNIESPTENTVICELAGGLPLSEIEANARLIATAPELLIACKRLLRQYEIVAPKWMNVEAINNMKKTISKAEGKQ
jgi:hypothetical protein